MSIVDGNIRSRQSLNGGHSPLVTLKWQSPRYSAQIQCAVACGTGHDRANHGCRGLATGRVRTVCPGRRRSSKLQLCVWTPHRETDDGHPRATEPSPRCATSGFLDTERPVFPRAVDHDSRWPADDLAALPPERRPPLLVRSNFSSVFDQFLSPCTLHQHQHQQPAPDSLRRPSSRLATQRTYAACRRDLAILHPCAACPPSSASPFCSPSTAHPEGGPHHGPERQNPAEANALVWRRRREHTQELRRPRR